MLPVCIIARRANNFFSKFSKWNSYDQTYTKTLWNALLYGRERDRRDHRVLCPPCFLQRRGQYRRGFGVYFFVVVLGGSRKQLKHLLHDGTQARRLH